MEGERRKRKLESEEENEEQKMEKFFALIKSTKDVRDLLFNKEKTDKKVDEEGLKGKATWTPTFQPEDFIDYGEFGRSNVSTPHADAGPSEKEEQKVKEVIMEEEHLQEAAPGAAAPAPELNEEKEKAGDHLDLNLSL